MYYVELDGKMISRAEYCKKFGICISTVTSMMSKQKITFEQAVEKCLELKNNDVYEISLKSAKRSLNNRWSGMRHRCYNPKDKDYPRYGGRGIKVCDRWHIFTNFFNDMYDSFILHVKKYGLRNTTLDRINVDGNYEPSNCEWKTIKEQNHNRCANIMITDDLDAKQFAEKYKLNYNLLLSRLKRGWTIEDILTTPAKAIHYLPCNNSLYKHCNQNNYNYLNILDYIKKYDLEPHEALAKYLEKKT